VVAAEAELTTRPAAGSLDGGVDAAGVERATRTAEWPAAGQRAAVAASAGKRALVVIHGAAGAGRTTTLAAARQMLDQQRVGSSGRLLTRFRRSS
jgi:exodeoxyribonuclease V alpha subunit